MTATASKIISENGQYLEGCAKKKIPHPNPHRIVVLRKQVLYPLQEPRTDDKWWEMLKRYPAITSVAYNGKCGVALDCHWIIFLTLKIHLKNWFKEAVS